MKYLYSQRLLCGGVSCYKGLICSSRMPGLPSTLSSRFLLLPGCDPDFIKKEESRSGVVANQTGKRRRTTPGLTAAQTALNNHVLVDRVRYLLLSCTYTRCQYDAYVNVWQRPILEFQIVPRRTVVASQGMRMPTNKTNSTY